MTQRQSQRERERERRERERERERETVASTESRAWYTLSFEISRA